ncbi:hypothetical protein H6768_01645 [Candidatus Peribacteria bacterium]|nr:hypothetical protein [Candidatus Peribacteria bacterium]
MADESCENKALVRNHIEHQYYQIIHYGRVLNGNRAYYTRHNPPFFPTLIKKYWKSLSPEEQEKETPWMQKMLL